MKISELKGTYFKNKLMAKRCGYRWHNRSSKGGNFGFEIRGVMGREFDLCGTYDEQGTVLSLSIGLPFRAGSKIPHENVDDVIKLIISICEDSILQKNF